MCGIAGIVIYDNEKDKDLYRKIKLMTDVVKHRGPNGEGHYIDNNIALGHRRLSILDLSELGSQPMEWNERLVLTYNGEIYNYIELREELINKGYSFKSETDSEVILVAYDAWGEECVHKFNGMWAFSIYDKINNILFCSRDRFGIKPFYYSETNNSFCFSSEIRQLLTLNKESPILNEEVAINYLVYNLSEYSEDTFFTGIKRLKAGHNLIIDLTSREISIKRFYEMKLRDELTKLSEVESINAFKERFEKAINFRLRSDVKVGTCLSGGLDSSCIAAISNKMHKQNSNIPFCAITASSVQTELDEVKYAKQVVEHLNLDWYVTKPESKDFLENIDDVIKTQEYPFLGPSVFMQYFVMKKAKEAGVTVLLDGQGADETLLGYSRYIPTLLYRDGIFSFIINIKKISKKYNLSTFYIFQNLIYFSFSKIRILRQKLTFPGLKPEYKKLLNTNLLKRYAESYRNIEKLQKLEIEQSQIPQLLRFEDKNSMAHSIETRLPFLDWEMVETSLSINNLFKLKNGWSKYVLRKALENELPKDIIWRKNKIGFAAPIDDWMKNFEIEMESVIDTSILLKKLFNSLPKKLNKHQKWRLYNFAKWELIFNVKAK